MDATLRKALLWLVLFALPLHGFAVSTMRLCPDPAMSAAAQAGHHSAVAAHDDCAGFADSASSACDASKASAGKCSLSTACSMVVAPAMTAEPVPMAESGISPVLADTPPEIAFCTGAPDRPPRPLV
jgi:hypothetical protein